jgi:hypothetical protein
LNLILANGKEDWFFNLFSFYKNYII